MSKDDALPGWLAVAIADAVAAFVVLFRTRINPALLVLCGALVSLVAFRAH